MKQKGSMLPQLGIDRRLEAQEKWQQALWLWARFQFRAWRKSEVNCELCGSGALDHGSIPFCRVTLISLDIKNKKFCIWVSGSHVEAVFTLQGEGASLVPILLKIWSIWGGKGKTGVKWNHPECLGFNQTGLESRVGGCISTSTTPDIKMAGPKGSQFSSTSLVANSRNSGPVLASRKVWNLRLSKSWDRWCFSEP